MSIREIPSQGLKNNKGPRPDPRINIIAGKAPASPSVKSIRLY